MRTTALILLVLGTLMAKAASIYNTLNWGDQILSSDTVSLLGCGLLVLGAGLLLIGCLRSLERTLTAAAQATAEALKHELNAAEYAHAHSEGMRYRDNHPPATPLMRAKHTLDKFTARPAMAASRQPEAVSG